MENPQSAQMQWQQYIETPKQREGRPVKLDEILAQRLKAFLSSRSK